MGRVLQQIETWAGAECAVVYDRLPKFGGHNLGAIEDAPDEFIRIGGKLALKESAVCNGVAGEVVTHLARTLSSCAPCIRKRLVTVSHGQKTGGFAPTATSRNTCICKRHQPQEMRLGGRREVRAQGPGHLHQ